MGNGFFLNMKEKIKEKFNKKTVKNLNVSNTSNVIKFQSIEEREKNRFITKTIIDMGVLLKKEYSSHSDCWIGTTAIMVGYYSILAFLPTVKNKKKFKEIKQSILNFLTSAIIDINKLEVK